MTSDFRHFGSWRIAGDFSRALPPSSVDEVVFTRAERALLRALVEKSGRVMSRDQLLDLVSGQGSDLNDRSVDFLINRLRRKLKDPARRPVFIATQYGEGYVWIAREHQNKGEVETAQIVLGPVQGLPPSGQVSSRGWKLVQRLADEIERRTGPERRVVIAPGGPDTVSGGLDGPYIGIAMNFLAADPDPPGVALTVRRLTDRAVLLTRRLRLDEVRLDENGAGKPVSEFAAALVEAIWSGLSHVDQDSGVPEDKPLAVQLQEAVGMLATYMSGWQEGERRLREAMVAEPENFQNHIMLATTLHSGLIIAGFNKIHKPSDWHSVAAEIEDLVIAALPHIQNNDVLLLAAAKLLWFADPKHRQLAIDLAEDAFASTTSLATALATVGQIRTWAGRGEEAVALFDQGLELAGDPTTHTSRYMMTLKAQALVSIGDHDAANACASELCRIAPALIPHYSILFAPSGAFDPDEVLAQVCGAMSPQDARAALRFVHYMSGRHHIDLEARRHIMTRPASVMVAHFGRSILPRVAIADLDSKEADPYADLAAE